MKAGYALIYMDNEDEPLPSINLDSFEFKTSLDGILPEGILRIKDPVGKVLEQMAGVTLGTHIKVKIVEKTSEPEDSRPEVHLCDMLIASVAEIPSDCSHVGGVLEMLLVHPWVFHQDYSCHLYKGIPNSEIIKKTLESPNRGFQFNINSDYIERSDEPGKVPRYKCGQSDYEFIVNNLLPYTTINNTPPVFWISENNEVHLQSISKMFLEDPCVIAVYNRGDIYNDPHFLEAAKDLGVKSFYLFNEMAIKIGDVDITQYIKPLNSKVMVEANLRTGDGLLGQVASKIKIGKDAGRQVASKLPFLKESIIGNTDCKVLSNRNTADQTRFLINTTTPFLKTFSLVLEGNFCGDQLQVGNTLYIYVPGSDESQGNLHWLSGIWLVSEIKHILNGKSDTTVNSEVQLIRPTFMFSKSASDVPLIDDYLGVKS